MWRRRTRRAVRGADNDGERTGPSLDKFGYEMLTLRQMEHNSLAWQVPSLSLTAQAFLLTIALGAGTAPLARVVSAALGMISGLLTMQLMGEKSLYGCHRANSTQTNERGAECSRCYVHQLDVSWNAKTALVAQDSQPYTVADWSSAIRHDELWHPCYGHNQARTACLIIAFNEAAQDSVRLR